MPSSTTVIIKLAKPTPPPIQLPTEPAEPLEGGAARSPDAEDDALPAPAPAPAHHSPAFDLMLARASLAVDSVTYLLLAIAPNGLLFAASSCLGALGMGFGPAVQSVALTLYNRRGGRDSGKLFGAMSVVQALRCVPRGTPFLRV